MGRLDSSYKTAIRCRDMFQVLACSSCELQPQYDLHQVRYVRALRFIASVNGFEIETKQNRILRGTRPDAVVRLTLRARPLTDAVKAQSRHDAVAYVRDSIIHDIVMSTDVL